MILNKKVQQRVQEHYDILQNKGYDVFCIFLQGSQNYQLDEYSDEYQSDVDTKAIVLPTLQDFILNKKPVSTTLILDNNEHIDVKDIRIMFDTFKKMNISYLELLYTKYYFCAPQYKQECQELLDGRNKITHMDEKRLVTTIYGMSKEKQKALCHPYPNLLEKIEKYGYDGKQLSHAVRLNFLLKKYLETRDLEDCFIPTQQQRALLMNYKKNKNACGEILSKEEAIALMDRYVEDTTRIKDLFTSTPAPNNILQDIQYKVLMKKIKEEIEKENKK